MPQRILQRVTRALLCLFLSTLTAFLSPAHAATPIVTYYHLDALGSPLAATDAQGNLLWKETYTAYGDRLQNAMAANTNTRWYTGHPDDSEVGLSYFGARWYDASLGRFMGVDPKDFSPGNLHSFNRYNYGNNNPYKYVDPDGRFNAIVLELAILTAAAITIYVIADPRQQAMRSQVAERLWEGLQSDVRPWNGTLTSGPNSSESDDGLILAKPPENARDPNGPKAPGKPGEAEGFSDPKGGENWVPNPNPGKGGGSHGWEDDKGRIWVPTGQRPGRAHGKPHWDVQDPRGGGNTNVRPGQNINDRK